MQSSLVVAGMDALSESCENILTRRANQRHYSIIAPFVKRRAYRHGDLEFLTLIRPRAVRSR
jgi:hypothetical protein